MDVPSKSKADKAGDTLKRFVRDGGLLADAMADDRLRESVATVQAWRAQYGQPLTGAAMGLRSMIATCGIAARPTQRQKRLERIIQKLARPKTTRLSTMQDIAGVRVVVPDVASLRRLQHHIEKTWNVDNTRTSGVVIAQATSDYITTPRSSGYRAVHLLVKYNERLVEVQLRTTHQHFWAELSEHVSREIEIELKAGEAPSPIADFFINLGTRVQALDEGDDSPWTLGLNLHPWGAQTLEVRYGPLGPEEPS